MGQVTRCSLPTPMHFPVSKKALDVDKVLFWAATVISIISGLTVVAVWSSFAPASRGYKSDGDFFSLLDRPLVFTTDSRYPLRRIAS